MNVVVGHGEPPEWAWGSEPYVRSLDETLPALLCGMGIYRTRSEARRAGRDGPVPFGFTQLRASKTKTIWIWREPPPKTEPEPPTASQEARLDALASWFESQAVLRLRRPRLTC